MKVTLIAVALGTFAIGAVSALVVSSAPGNSVTAGLSETVTNQWHSLQDFEGIRQGLSYDEATRILGRMGHLGLGLPEGVITEIEAGSEVFTWPNPNGSRIVLVFRQNRLVQKVQFGLR